jgi:outer membrane lipoprotein carrier protein
MGNQTNKKTRTVLCLVTATDAGQTVAVKQCGSFAAALQSGCAAGVLMALLWCGLFAGAAWAQAPENGNDYIKKFESSYHDVRSLSADFVQTYTLGGRTRTDTGRVIFARGGLMRWDYDRPTKKLFISDGKEMSLYVPEEHQLTRAPMKSSQDFRAPFELLLSRFNFRKIFAKVEVDDAALPHGPGDHVLRAFPKKQFADAYQDVLIALDPQFNLRQLVVDYPDRSRMYFRFDHIKRDPAAPPSLFHFTPPPGTEIIDQNQEK